MNSIWRRIKFVLWDSWHGESLSAYDVRRTSRADSPDVVFGDIKISKNLIKVLAALLVFLILLAVVLSVTRISFTTSEGLSGLTKTDACFAVDSIGRQFVALDCIYREYIASMIPGFLLAVAIYLLGVFTGWMIWRRRS